MGVVEASGVARPTGMPARRDVVLFKKLDENAVIPVRAHETDAGYDLCSMIDFVLPAQALSLIPTGVAVAIPTGAVGLVAPRSGLAAKHGITITNSPGIIDSGYRGELKVILQNCSQEDFVIKAGDRIAQLVVVPYLGLSTEVSDLPEADRGEAGFGSTGL